MGATGQKPGRARWIGTLLSSVQYCSAFPVNDGYVPSPGKEFENKKTRGTPALPRKKKKQPSTFNTITVPSSPSPFGRLVRFIPRSDPTQVLLGEPTDADLDVGLAIRAGYDVPVTVWSGTSVLNPGRPTKEVAIIDHLLSPLATHEVGTIRCVGFTNHSPKPIASAEIDDLASPQETQCVFLKPGTALADPYQPTRTSTPTPLPRLTLGNEDDGGDKDDSSTSSHHYEAQVAIVIGRECKNVLPTADDALQYVLGYTAAAQRFPKETTTSSGDRENEYYFSSQDSPGFDGSCRIGPCLVSSSRIPDPGLLLLRVVKNGVKVKDVPKEGADEAAGELTFDVPSLISFVSKGTTLPAGTVILAGVGSGGGESGKRRRSPRVTVKAGDELRVELSNGVGTLVAGFEDEK